MEHAMTFHWVMSQLFEKPTAFRHGEWARRVSRDCSQIDEWMNGGSNEYELRGRRVCVVLAWPGGFSRARISKHCLIFHHPVKSTGI